MTTSALVDASARSKPRAIMRPGGLACRPGPGPGPGLSVMGERLVGHAIGPPRATPRTRPPGSASPQCPCQGFIRHDGPGDCTCRPPIASHMVLADGGNCLALIGSQPSIARMTLRAIRLT